jgi:hypothetical protein
MAARMGAGIVAAAMRGTSATTKLALAAVATIAALLASAGPVAAAPPERGAYVPATLTATIPTPRFVVHYDPAAASPVAGMTIAQYAASGAADFEEAYGREVVSGGLVPNAGLRAPTPDDDGRTDVYLSAPKSLPGFSGGIVFTDLLPWNSSYVFMTPDMGRLPFRFRAAHEFMHVIQGAYTPRVGEGLLEAFANWAAEWALPDIDPLDNNFYPEQYRAPHPWLPLDCSYEEWRGVPCGNGYWQWLFVQSQVEDFGPAFVSGYYERFAATHDGRVSWLLESQVGQSSGGAQTLSGRFAAYAVKVWDPTRWSTGSISRILSELGLRPASYIYYRSTRDTGIRPITVDHLAARYVRYRNYTEVAEPGETLLIEWTRPVGMAGAVVPLVRYAGQAGWVPVGRFGGTAGSVSVPFGPDIEDVVLPLVNDSVAADNLPFSYRVQMIAPPEPPDATAPRTRIRKRPRKRTTSRVARFVFAANEPATFKCKLDRRKFRPCPRRARFRVKLGRHTLRVRATDTAGNTDRTAARYTWKVVKRLPKQRKR